MSLKKNIVCLSLFLMLGVLLGACTATIINRSPSLQLPTHSTYAVLPFQNHTETPLAGDKASSMVSALIESHGIPNVMIYHRPTQTQSLFPEVLQPINLKEGYAWAKKYHAQYIVTGSVNEWSYKVGLDGEPVVGLSMQVIEVATGQIIWTATGSKSGGSRVAVTTVAQQLMNEMMLGIWSKQR